jgi:predicted acyltransferase
MDYLFLKNERLNHAFKGVGVFSLFFPFFLYLLVGFTMNFGLKHNQ